MLELCVTLLRFINENYLIKTKAYYLKQKADFS